MTDQSDTRQCLSWCTRDLSLSLSLSLSLFLPVCLSLPLCLSLPVPACLPACLCVSLCVCVSCVCLLSARALCISPDQQQNHILTGRREANRWSSVMYGRVIPMAILSMYGTGVAGSLTYSSNPGLPPLDGGLKDNAPPTWKWSDCGVAAAGGHSLNRRHSLAPTSKTIAAGKSATSAAGVPGVARCFRSNGRSIYRG